MPTSRTVYRYYLKQGNKILLAGITNNPERRLCEHQHEYGKNIRLKEVGYRTTREAAMAWEEEQRQKGKLIADATKLAATAKAAARKKAKRAAA